MITEHGLITTTYHRDGRFVVKARHVMSGKEAQSDESDHRSDARAQALERLEEMLNTGGDAGGGGPIA